MGCGASAPMEEKTSPLDVDRTPSARLLAARARRRQGGVASTREGALGDDLGARDAAERERDTSSGVVDDPFYKVCCSHYIWVTNIRYLDAVSAHPCLAGYRRRVALFIFICFA